MCYPLVTRKKEMEMGNFCTNCGEKLKEGARFCGNCGTACEEKSAVEKNDINIRQSMLERKHVDNIMQQRNSTSAPSQNSGGIWKFLAGTAIGTFIGSFFGSSSSSHSKTINNNETIINDYGRNEDYDEYGSFQDEHIDDSIELEYDDSILNDEFEEEYDSQYDDYDDEYDDYDEYDEDDEDYDDYGDDDD